MADGIISGLISLNAVIYSVIVNNSLHAIKNYKDYITEFVVIKELLYTIGWLLSFVLMYFSSGLNTTGLSFIFYTIIIGAIISPMVLIKIGVLED